MVIMAGSCSRGLSHYSTLSMEHAASTASASRCQKKTGWATTEGTASNADW